MDALYARDFSLANIEDRTLDAIADLFGPLNLDTVAQAIHFARRNTITDRTGRPFVATASVLRERWPLRGTVSIHGSKNGLVDVKTLEAMHTQMEYAGVPYQEVAASARGHLDRLASLYVTPAREAELVATFKEATRLETDFWDMGWRMGLRGA